MKIILVAAVVLLAAGPVRAQQSVPKTSGNPLEEICKSFMEQSGQGVSGDRNKLCTCLVRETQAHLTQREMEIYSQAGQTGEQPPPAIMEKIVGVATTCLSGQ